LLSQNHTLSLHLLKKLINMDAQKSVEFSNTIASIVNLVDLDKKAARSVFAYIAAEEKKALLVACKTPTKATFSDTAVGTTPASPTEHKLKNQSTTKPSDTKESEPQSKIPSPSLTELDTHVTALEQSFSASYFAGLRATPNKIIAERLANNPVKKRKAAEDLAAADAKKTKTAADAPEAPAVENMMSTIEEEIEQLERDNKLAMLRKKHRLELELENVKKA